MAGPSPGALHLAAMRCKLRHSPTSMVSFKRVGIKPPILSVRNSNRRRLMNMSADMADDSQTEMGQDSSMATIEADAIGNGI